MAIYFLFPLSGLYLHCNSEYYFVLKGEQKNCRTYVQLCNF